MIDFQYNFNTLDIPSIMGPYFVVPMGIAGALVPILFTMEMVNEHTRALHSPDDKTPHVIKIIARTFTALLVCFFLYKWIFLKIVAICEAIGFAMYKGQQWDKFIENFVKTGQGEINMFNLGVASFGASIFGLILNIIEDVFLMIRFVVLAVLYVIGPFAIVGGISKITRGYTGGWFKMVFQVSFWVVIFRALQGVLLALNEQIGGAWYQSLTAPVVNGLVITVFAISVPHFVQALFSTGYFSHIAQGTIQSFQNSGNEILQRAGNLFTDKLPNLPNPDGNPPKNTEFPNSPMNDGAGSKTPSNPKVR